jgi:hypothetical protein
VPAGQTLTVDDEAGLEFVRRVDQRRREDRQPVSRRERESVGAVGGDLHRRVGRLQRQIGNGDAFLIAFDQRAACDSPNFLWFRQRYRRFHSIPIAPATVPRFRPTRF